jgi:hypothetical protein
MDSSSPENSPNTSHNQINRSVKQRKAGNIEGLIIKRGDIRIDSTKNVLFRKKNMKSGYE